METGVFAEQTAGCLINSRVESYFDHERYARQNRRGRWQEDHVEHSGVSSYTTSMMVILGHRIYLYPGSEDDVARTSESYQVPCQ